jgi:hypothetical protein
MLPFLKDRHEGSASGPVESIKRESDEDGEDFGMLDAIVEDMLDAFHKKDKKILKGALEALIEHIQGEEIPDEGDMK